MARPDDEIIKDRQAFLQLIKDCADKPSLFSEVFLDHEVYDYNLPYVDSNERFIIYRSGRQAGKTMSTAAKAIHFAFFAPILVRRDNPKDATIIIAAPTQNQSAIMFGRVRALIEESRMLSKMIVRNTQTEITVRWLNGKGTTNIITRATGDTGMTLRGYSPDVIIADECAFMRESIMVAFMPSGMATQASVWLTSTPFGMNNYFYKKCMEARPTQKDGVWQEYHVSSLQNPRIAGDTLFQEEIKHMSKDEYRQEVLGEFLDIGDALIPRSLLVDSLSDKVHPPDVRYYLGVDVARTGRDETVFTLIAVDRQDIVWLVETYAEGQSNLVDVVGKMRDYTYKYAIDTIYCDETGLGGGVIDLARKTDLPIRGITFSMTEKAEIYANVRVLFERHQVRMREMGETFTQLQFLKRDYTPEGKMKIVVEEKVHDDYADSFALACSVLRTSGSWHIIPMNKKIQKMLFG